MKSTLIQRICLILMLLASSLPVCAQNAPGTTTHTISTGGKTEAIPIETEPGLKAFLDTYLAANNAKDTEKLKAMRHPKDLAAWTDFWAHQPAAPGQKKPTLEQSLLRPTVPENHPPFVVLRFLKDSPLPQAAFVDWPVPPTHEVQLTYETAPNSTTAFLLELVREGDHWFAVGGVPDAEFIKKMTQGKKP
jgi:hypothetical protein